MKTFSGILLHFNSHLPFEYRKGLLHTLLYQECDICLNYTNLHQEIVCLKSVWQKNSFPLFFIDKCVHKFSNSLFLKRHHLKPSSEKKEVILSLECLGKLSLQVKKQLTDIFQSCHKKINLTVVFKSYNRIHHAVCFKEPLPKSINLKVLYEYTCDICIVSTLVKPNDIFQSVSTNIWELRS